MHRQIAKELADAAGVTLGQIMTISSYGGTPVPIYEGKGGGMAVAEDSADCPGFPRPDGADGRRRHGLRNPLNPLPFKRDQLTTNLIVHTRRRNNSRRLVL